MNRDLLAISGAAYDAQALNDLKRQATADPQGSLLQVAQQIEGLFVQMMLKSMRAALPPGGLLSSEQTRLYTAMYDQQLAQQMSQKGLGLAEMMLKQLSVTHAGQSAAAGIIVPMLLGNDGPYTAPSQILAQRVRRAVPKMPPEAPIPLTNGNFVARLSIPARLASQQSGIPHQLIMAQAALESGWGQREIPAADGSPSHNLFGIKAGSSWQGPVTEITTTEFTLGAEKKIKARFRVYGSYAEALSDYIKLLTNNPRYAGVVSARSPEQAAHALQQAGYATDPQYARKLVNLMQQMQSANAPVATAYAQDLNDLF
ncbi:flagellar rod assembly protein FlgJ [Chania multitudinisentens RB-25]|uniref:Peptidoglycan hydrolase FlgJ n=1 Tax=Chania multitudinisentens RB-25 TaxID=1441930 RepID=W0LE97_9GAMM|nr:flagellar assembly peptidoglycan hydrolase FlgJ [Chania multitudinisentens]AHG22051.1 flagellar rod assembly protein FlgJ [Chania multitudinisentens RB-25]